MLLILLTTPLVKLVQIAHPVCVLCVLISLHSNHYQDFTHHLARGTQSVHTAVESLVEMCGGDAKSAAGRGPEDLGWQKFPLTPRGSDYFSCPYVFIRSHAVDYTGLQLGGLFCSASQDESTCRASKVSLSALCWKWLLTPLKLHSLTPTTIRTEV